MNAEIGATVTVEFNGSHYPGEVVGITKSGLRLVRFTTGSGTTRERKFSAGALAHFATAPSPRERGRSARKAARSFETGLSRWGQAHNCHIPGETRTCPACPRRTT